MRLICSLAAVFAASFAAPTFANDLTPIQKIMTARAMYDIGVSSEDALLIMAAAKLRKQVPLDEVDRAPEGGGREDGTPLEWAAMLQSAAPLVTGDPTLEGLLEDIEAERSKGVKDGPVYSIANIRNGGKDTYDNVQFVGGNYAEIYVEGPKGSDLNLIIRDSKGRLVCSDTDISAIAYCGWKPTQSGVFQVTVISEQGGGKYSLVSN